MSNNVIYPAAFAGKPVVVNPKGQRGRRGRLRLCPDLSARRRQKLYVEQREREKEQIERRRQEEEAQRLANAPGAAELLAMFTELMPWLEADRQARATLASVLKIHQEIAKRRPWGPSAA